MKLAGLSILFLVPAVVAAQEPASNSSKTAQADKASITGNAPENHSSLADYFRNLALQEQVLAESYERLAATYKKALTAGLDSAAASEMKDQYRRLTEVETKAAKAAGELADFHSRLAEELSLVAAAPRHPNPGEAAFRK